MSIKAMIAQKVPDRALEYPVFGFSFARFLNYRAQHTILNLIVKSMPFLGSSTLFSQRDEKTDQVLFKELTELLRQDSKNIAEGIYPLSVLTPERPLSHLRRIPKILTDGFRIYFRRQKREHKSFSKEAKEYLAEVPEYFRRNYHFQTDGYLSEHSAELYEHQVELLFSGTADAMRRILLKPLKTKVQDSPEVKFLELACGTGRMTRFVRQTFNRIKLVATDVSSPYLKVARKKLSDLTRIDFLQTDATQLPFKENSFDVVYSVFMFHELPPEARDEVIKEGLRVLKPGGIFCLVDSVQMHDFKEVKTALENFPVDFHEPFYKHYSLNPIEDLLERNGFTQIEKHRGFLSKAVLAVKP